MEFQEWLVPVLEDYIRLKQERRSSVIQTGEIPKTICEVCHTRNPRQFVEALTMSEKRIAEEVTRQVERNEIISLDRRWGNDVSIRSRKPIREICPNPDDYDSEVTEWKDRDEDGKFVYHYTVSPYMEAFKSTFLKPVFETFHNGIAVCSHSQGPYLRDIDTMTTLCFRKEEHVPYEDRSLAGRRRRLTKKWTKALLFACDECHEEMSKRACPDAFEFIEYMYQNRRCLWENTLLLELLRRTGREFSLLGSHTPVVVIEPDKVLLSFGSHVDDDVINQVNPSLLVIFGSKIDIVPLMKFGTDVVCMDDGKIVMYDSTVEIQADIDEIIRSLIRNLEAYADEARGNDHARYIKALMEIGREMGFVPQDEYTAKGSRVDCVWFNREGHVYGAIEVEFSGGIKKDIVSTWELEPKLAIILNQTKTDRPILNLLDYEVMKSIPHPLIAINTGTKTLYYFERQQNLLTKTLETPEEDHGPAQLRLI